MKREFFLPLGLLALILCTPSVARGQASQKMRQACVTNLSGWPALYRALYSLPETRAHLVEAVGQENFNRIGPSNLPGNLSAEHRQGILEAIEATIADMPANEQRAFCQRLESWLIIDMMLLASAKLGVPEAAMAAEYAVPLTRDLYDPIVKNRGFPPDVSPAMIAETIDGHEEGAVISIEIRNRLSLLKRRERVRYFRDLLEQIDKLLPEFGVKE